MIHASNITLPTLAQTLWNADGRVFRSIMLAIIGSLAVWVSAKIQVPFYPVPITMQTLVVLGIGMAFGWRLGAATIALYLFEGAVGLPVFAGTPEKGIGLGYLFGPTGGYLLGFMPAVMICGYLAERGWDRNVIKTGLAMILGNFAIYGIGLLWLGTMIGWDKPILAWGLYPFMLGDGAKIVLAAIGLPVCWRLIRSVGDK